MQDVYRVGLLGLGSVGQDVASRLTTDSKVLFRRTGVRLELARVAVNDFEYRHAGLQPKFLTTSIEEIVCDKSIDIIVELMGGYNASQVIQAALKHGKDVVTASTEAIANYGKELSQAAADYGRSLGFGATVLGGMPMAEALTARFRTDHVHSIDAILRTGYETENHMAGEGPAGQQSGLVAQKLAILATLAFGQIVNPGEIATQGMAALGPEDFAFADKLGYQIVLLASAQRHGDESIYASVAPTMIQTSGGYGALAAVKDVDNYVRITTAANRRFGFFGEASGEKATAQAVLADIINVANQREMGGNIVYRQFCAGLPATMKPEGSLVSQFYMRLTAPDKAGILARVTEPMGEMGINIKALEQPDAKGGDATVYLITRPVEAARVYGAVDKIVTEGIACRPQVLRVR